MDRRWPILAGSGALRPVHELYRRLHRRLSFRSAIPPGTPISTRGSANRSGIPMAREALARYNICT